MLIWGSSSLSPVHKCLCDWMPPLSLTQRNGGTISKALCSLAQEIVLWTKVHFVILSARCILGKKTGLADKLSCPDLVLSTEGSILPRVFVAICEVFHPRRVTRGSLSINSLSFSPMRFHTSQYSRCFIPATTKLWNELPSMIVETTELQKFKIVANAFLLGVDGL